MHPSYSIQPRRLIRFWLVLVLAMFATCAMVRAEGTNKLPLDLTGSYSIHDGVRPGSGEAYTGKVRLQKEATHYRVAWENSLGHKMEGRGRYIDDQLAFFAASSPECALAVFKLQGELLRGEWLDAKGGSVTEIWEGSADLDGDYHARDTVAEPQEMEIQRIGEFCLIRWRGADRAERYGVGLLSRNRLFVARGPQPNSVALGLVTLNDKGADWESIWVNYGLTAPGKEQWHYDGPLAE